MAIECDACGASVAVGARFCGECGAVVRAKTRELERTGSGRSARTTQPVKPKSKESLQRSQGKTIPMGGARGPAPAKAPAQRPPAPDALRATVRGVPVPAAPVSTTPAPAPPTAAAASPPSAAGPPVAAAVAPPAPTSAPRNDFQRLLDEVETGFDAILDAPIAAEARPTDDASGPPTTESEFDESQAKQLFFELVIANARPIRDFMIEVRLGEPHAAWVDFCAPSVKAILGSAQGMGYEDLAAKLRSFIEMLDRVKRSPGGIVRGEVRERVIDAYGELIVFLPEAFGLEAEANAREAAIVRALLADVQGLHKVGLDRVHATGLVGLGLFYATPPHEIAALCGIPAEVAERIVARFRAYRAMVSELSPARGRSDERARLRRAAEAMVEAARAYDVARPASSERRAARRARASAMSEASIWLARLGEVERLRQLVTLPYAQRGTEILGFVADAEKRAGVVERAL